MCALAPRSRIQQAVMFAALWTLAELMRGRWLTGFPWGAGGYAQVDLMAAWAPWVGVYGMGAIAALLAFALAAALSALGGWMRQGLFPTARRPGTPDHLRGYHQRGRAMAVAHGLSGAVLLVVLLASVLWGDAWRDQGQRDTAAHGELRVWLLQGNIAQDQKFEPGTGVAQALRWYPEQIAAAAEAARGGGSQGPQLVVAPETALPMLPEQLGDAFWKPMLQGLSQPGASLGALLGLPLGSYEQGYTNSAWGIEPGSAAAAQPDGYFRYDKHHLVPFGEFIPPLFRWFTDLMRIPLGDFNRGALAQPAWSWAGQRIAPNICYEDLFGEELAASFQDPATAPTVLVNLSNIAWFGDTVAIDQHLQASRLRALELGRPMLRATNTGATAVINHRGEVTHRLARLTRGRLEAVVEGRSGSTPFARWAGRWGLWPAWVACLTVVALLASRRPRRRRARGALMRPRPGAGAP
jgi:apolipoprotein N-acyltransferase